MRVRLAIAAAGMMLAATAHAADIAWVTGPAFGGASGFGGILTNGTLVQAIDVGSGASTRTVDPTGLNIKFTTVDPIWLTAYIFDAVGAFSSDAGWNAVIGDADWNGGDTSAPAALTGLTPGHAYQLQLFAADTRGCCSTRQSRFGDGNGHFSPFVVQGSLTSIVGIFVADAGTQALATDTSSSAPILNAYLLRDVSAIPEPAPSALLLVGIGLFRAARRRSAG